MVPCLSVHPYILKWCMEPCRRVRWKGGASQSPSRGVLGPGAGAVVTGRDRQRPLLRCWGHGCESDGRPSTLLEQRSSGATGAVLQTGAAWKVLKAHGVATGDQATERLH